MNATASHPASPHASRPTGASTGLLDRQLADALRTLTHVRCERCERHPDRGCPACNARRRRAVRLVEVRGLSVEATAATMGLSIARVKRLLEEQADRREIATLMQSNVDNATLRQVFDRQRRQQPWLTLTELAERLHTSPVQVERWLGLIATAPKTDRHGRVYPARTLETVGVDVAGRIVRALGYAPCEIDGC